jgi:hypothetical protein
LPKEAFDITTKYMQKQHGQFPIVTLKCLWLENMLLMCPYPRGWTSIGGKPVKISLQKITVYFIGKIKPNTNHFDIWSIWPFSHTGQINLNTSNLISGFFTYHKMVLFINQIRQKIGQPKKIN